MRPTPDPRRQKGANQQYQASITPPARSSHPAFPASPRLTVVGPSSMAKVYICAADNGKMRTVSLRGFLVGGSLIGLSHSLLGWNNSLFGRAGNFCAT